MTDKAHLDPKQIQYRDARFTDKYDEIWQSVGKCVFCDLRDKYIIHEENGIVLTVTLFAYSDGHIMIIPRRHLRSMKDMTQKEWETVRKFTYIAKRLIKSVHGVKGMQFIQKDGSLAQSTVEHIHFHCVPFNNPNLNTWNYQKLALTPIESANLYRHERKKIANLDVKFTEKYTHRTSLPIVCDALIRNKEGALLFEQRHKQYALVPDYITLPGGFIDSLDVSFEAELVREVNEEIGVKLDESKFRLIRSVPQTIKRKSTSKTLNMSYSNSTSFVWNTYLYEGTIDEKNLKAGDDAAAFVWVQPHEVAKHAQISEGIKEILTKVKL